MVTIPLHCAVCACVDDAAAANMARYARVHKQQNKRGKPVCSGYHEECAACGVCRSDLRLAIWFGGWRFAE